MPAYLQAPHDCVKRLAGAASCAPTAADRDVTRAKRMSSRHAVTGGPRRSARRRPLPPTREPLRDRLGTCVRQVKLPWDAACRIKGNIPEHCGIYPPIGTRLYLPSRVRMATAVSVPKRRRGAPAGMRLHQEGTFSGRTRAVASWPSEICASVRRRHVRAGAETDRRGLRIAAAARAAYLAPEMEATGPP